MSAIKFILEYIFIWGCTVPLILQIAHIHCAFLKTNRWHFMHTATLDTINCNLRNIRSSFVLN